MYNTYISLITLNVDPKFPLAQSKNWYTHNFKNTKRILNFIQFKRRKYCAFIYTKGRFKFTLSNIKFVPCIENIAQRIIIKYVSKIFEGPIPQFSIRISQILISFHLINKIDQTLSAEKIKDCCRSLEIKVNELTFRFDEADFDFSSTDNPSHFIVEVFYLDQLKIGTLNLYSNFKITAMVSSLEHLQMLHDYLPLFVENLKE